MCWADVDIGRSECHRNSSFRFSDGEKSNPANKKVKIYNVSGLVFKNWPVKVFMVVNLAKTIKN